MATITSTTSTKLNAVPVCRKFQLGRCFGSCKFLHQEESTDQNYISKKRYREEEYVFTPSTILPTTGASTLSDQKKQCRPVATMRVKKKQKEMNSSTRASEESKLNLSGEELRNINGLLRERQTARDNRDWSKADQLREQLKASHNVIVKDSKSGPPVWAIGDDWKMLMNVSAK